MLLIAKPKVCLLQSYSCVIRGGGWNFLDHACRSHARDGYKPMFNLFPRLGLRIVLRARPDIVSGSKTISF
jgi:hypothetical protein